MSQFQFCYTSTVTLESDTRHTQEDTSHRGSDVLSRRQETKTKQTNRNTALQSNPVFDYAFLVGHLLFSQGTRHALRFCSMVKQVIVVFLGVR